jgi:uncharacterized protein (DUF4415 family)
MHMAIKTAPVVRPAPPPKPEVARDAPKRPASPTKGVRVTLVVPPDVLAAYKAGGRFYQTRMVEALRREAGL